MVQRVRLLSVIVGFSQAAQHHSFAVESNGAVEEVHQLELDEQTSGDYADVDVDLIGGDIPLEGDAISCSMEKAIKTIWGAPSTSSIRSVFHDAMDHNNLLLKNQNTGRWEPFELKEGHGYGGLDGCLYSPLSQGTAGFPNPDHNRNVPGTLPKAADICRATCNLKPSLKICKGPKLNGVSANCALDVTIIAANAAISKLTGPEVPMLWGHRKGSCGFNGIVTPHQKFCRKDCQKKYSQSPALRFAPSFTDIGDPAHFTETFERLGFDAQDHVALMGAHSVGIIEPCAAGLNGVEVGPSCKSATTNIPPVTQKFVMGADGNCTLTHKNSCWRRNGNGAYTPVHKHTNGKNTLAGYGDGGTWDRTPNKFDNDYFKIMRDSDYEDMNLCCGSTNGGKVTRLQMSGLCGRTGNLRRLDAGGFRNTASWNYNWKTGKECYWASGEWERKEPSKKIVGPFDDRWKAPKNAKVKCYSKDGEWLNALNSTERRHKNPMHGVHPSHIRISASNKNTQGKQCNAGSPSFCRDDRKGRTHMKSMNIWTRVPAYLLKNAANHGNILRTIRLPGDWALLGGEKTRNITLEFAEDQSKFFDSFATAWRKVLEKTEAPLESCTGEVDEAEVDKFVAEFKKRLSLVQSMQDSDVN